MNENRLGKRLGLLAGAAVLLFAAMFAAGPARAADGGGDTPEVVGSVKTVTGQAFYQRGEERLAASVGNHLHQGDVLVTGSGSSIGVIFRDDTILSLGPGSEVCIDRFVFDPSKGNMNFLVKVGKGTAQFISGQMARISPESMSVETPLSTIGIRGTRFLVKVD